MLKGYYVLVDPADLKRLLDALDRVTKSVYDWTYNQMPKRGSMSFLTLLKSDLMSQRYGSLYQALNPDYAKWKGNDTFWFLKNDFYKALSAFRLNSSAGILEFGGGQWMAGIAGGLKDSGGKSWFYPIESEKQASIASRTIAMYAFYGEYGHGGLHPQPARPIFYPTMCEYQLGGWSDLGDEALKSVGKDWR